MSFIWALYLLLNYCKNWSCWDEFYVGWILYEMCIFLNDTSCAMGCGGTKMGRVELRSYLATSSSMWLPCKRHVAAASASCCCHSVPHVDKPQRDTWRCVKEPRHHIHVSTRLATSAASMGCATWHPLPWPISWPFGLVIEEIYFYDEKRVGHGKVPLLWPKWPIGHGRPNVTELLWTIQFGHKLVIKNVPWPNLHAPWPNRLVIDAEYCTSDSISEVYASVDECFQDMEAMR
jgi:hypothetical protein